MAMIFPGGGASAEVSVSELNQLAELLPVLALPTYMPGASALDAGTYRYRVSTVRTAAVTEGEWKQKTSAILWIVTADLA